MNSSSSSKVNMCKSGKSLERRRFLFAQGLLKKGKVLNRGKEEKSGEKFCTGYWCELNR